MNRVKFISVDYLRMNSTIEENVDDNKLIPFIYKSQDNYLQQVLGSTFFFHLSNAIINNALTTVEEDLIRVYIQPMVSEYTLYEAIPFLNYKLTNKAVSQENSEFSVSSELSNIKYMRNIILDMCEYYSERLVRQLCDYSELYPKYNNPDDNENVRANSNVYKNSVYIPKRGGCNGCNDFN